MLRSLMAAICLSLLLGFTPPVSAADEAMNAAAIKAFEPIVEKVSQFFGRHPKLLTKIAAPDNPNQIAFSITHFQTDRIMHNILTTNSLIMPYTAYIDIDTQTADNKPCGNQAFAKLDKEGWSNIDEAIANANNRACFVIRTPQIGVIRHRFIFNYHLKTGRWALNEILYQDGTINGRFMAVLGVPSPWFPIMKEPQATSFNRDWIQLFKEL